MEFLYRYRYEQDEPSTVTVAPPCQKECPLVHATPVPHDKEAEATMYISAIVDNIHREISSHRTDPPEERQGSHRSQGRDKHRNKSRGRSKSKNKGSRHREKRDKSSQPKEEDVSEVREPKSSQHYVERVEGRNGLLVYRERKAVEVPMFREHGQLESKPHGRWQEQERTQGNLQLMEFIEMRRASSCPHPADPPGIRAMSPRQEVVVERAPRYSFPSISYVASEDIELDHNGWKLMQACTCQRKKEGKKPTRPIDVPRGTTEPSVIAGNLFGLESLGHYFHF